MYKVVVTETEMAKNESNNAVLEVVKYAFSIGAEMVGVERIEALLRLGYVGETSSIKTKYTEIEEVLFNLRDAKEIKLAYSKELGWLVKKNRQSQIVRITVERLLDRVNFSPPNTAGFLFLFFIVTTFRDTPMACLYKITSHNLSSRGV